MSEKFLDCAFMQQLRSEVKPQNFDASCMVVLRTISRALDAPIQRGHGRKVWQIMVDAGVLRPLGDGWSSVAWLKENGFYYGPDTAVSDAVSDDERAANMARLAKMLETL